MRLPSTGGLRAKKKNTEPMNRDPQERSAVVAEAVAHGAGEGGADEGPEHDHGMEVPPPVEIGGIARRQAVNQRGEGDDEAVRRYDK